MTIFKTQPKKEEKINTTVLIEKEAIPLNEDVPEASVRPPPVGLLLAHRRRVRLTNTCIFISTLMILAVGAVGGFYMYKHFAHKLYIGQCGVKYTSTEFAHLTTNNAFMKKHVRRGYMEERVTIDSYGMYERIEVPDFDDCSHAVVLHEFVKNLTAIVDRNAGHCFVMPLNRREVRPPKDLWDLISKLRSGYYMPNSHVVRHYYKVMRPAVHDASVFGPYIATECFMLDTYRLKKRKREYRNQHSSREKRSVDHNNQKYGVYSGKSLNEYIIDMNEGVGLDKGVGE